MNLIFRIAPVSALGLAFVQLEWTSVHIECAYDGFIAAKRELRAKSGAVVHIATVT